MYNLAAIYVLTIFSTMAANSDNWKWTTECNSTTIARNTVNTLDTLHEQFVTIEMLRRHEHYHTDGMPIEELCHLYNNCKAEFCQFNDKLTDDEFQELRPKNPDATAFPILVAENTTGTGIIDAFENFGETVSNIAKYILQVVTKYILPAFLYVAILVVIIKLAIEITTKMATISYLKHIIKILKKISKSFRNEEN
jgi:hypothetical protein